MIMRRSTPLQFRSRVPLLLHRQHQKDAAHHHVLNARRRLHTSCIFRAKEKTPLSRMEMVDLHVNDQERSAATFASSLDANLFADPSGGLEDGPVEELTTTEVEANVQVLIATHVSELFFLLYTPLVDLVHILIREQLLPDASSSPSSSSSSPSAPRVMKMEEEISRWFVDGISLLKAPSTTMDAMGSKRWPNFCAALARHHAPMHDVMPLVYAIHRRGLPEEIFVPMLRQLAMDLADPAKRSATVAMLPGLTLALAHDRAPASLCLPHDAHARVATVAELYLAAAQETGNTDLAFVGMQLLRVHDLVVPFTLQKQLTNVFASSARIQTDWQMRQSGQLVEALPRWISTYYKKVDQDRRSAAEQRHEAAASSSSTTTEEVLAMKKNSAHDDTPVAYFASRRAESIERLSALEANISAIITNNKNNNSGTGSSSITEEWVKMDEDDEDVVPSNRSNARQPRSAFTKDAYEDDDDDFEIVTI